MVGTCRPGLTVLTRHGLTLSLRKPEEAERGLEVVIRGPLVPAAG